MRTADAGPATEAEMSGGAVADGTTGTSGGVTVHGARLPLHHASSDALVERTEAVLVAAQSADEAVDRLGTGVWTSIAQAGSGAGRAFSSAADRLTVSFGEVEAMTSTSAVLSRDLIDLAGRTAAISLDGDVLASLPLSPVTGAAVEAVLGSAATGLTASALKASALAVAIGAVVSSFAAADAWLAAAAGSLRATGLGVLSLAGAGTAFAGTLSAAAGTAVVAQLRADARVATAAAGTVGDLALTRMMVPALAVGSLAVVADAFAAETLRSLRIAFAEADQDFGGDGTRFNPFDAADFVRFGAVLAAGFDSHFSLDAALTGSVGGVQSLLGATGPFYDDILAGLVTTGFALGFFHDGDVTVKPAAEVDAGVMRDSASESWKAIHGDGGGFDRLDGRIVPVDWPSMMAGLAQIDDIGGTERAIIRVFTVYDAMGVATGYRVQIPSTARWNPIAHHGSPGDITSDVYAMWQGSETALANAVYEAMRQSGIPTGASGLPVELDGFSLGGITAAAIAADPRGYNITEIHTAGSPIGGMAIAERTRVYSLEAEQDIVASLDGRTNPGRPGWTTVTGPGVQTHMESIMPPMFPGTVHSPRRYAVMAAMADELHGIGALDVPDGGSVSIVDYEAIR